MYPASHRRAQLHTRDPRGQAIGAFGQFLFLNADFAEFCDCLFALLCLQLQDRQLAFDDALGRFRLSGRDFARVALKLHQFLL